MKNRNIKLYSLLSLILVIGLVEKGYGQVSPPPDGIIFQAVATDPEGNPAANRTIDVKSSILQSTATGSVVYSESFQVTASATGVFTIVIGKGIKLSGPASIGSIDWSAGPYFLNLKAAVEPTVPAAGWLAANEYVDMGTSQFWSVPFALYAGNVAGMSLKLNIADTTGMLANYKSSIIALNSSTAALVADSVYQATQIAARVKYTDTAAMLTNYRTALNSGQAAKVNYSDTAAMLTNYRIGFNSVQAAKVNYSDTAAMLLNYRAGLNLSLIHI